MYFKITRIKQILQTRSVDPRSGRHVLGGMGGGCFAPPGLYNREQTICAVLRLYENWEMKVTRPEEYEMSLGLRD